jgi:glycosyltransferase involved in cell wall biosynthesis
VIGSRLSVIIPAKNESTTLGPLIHQLFQVLPGAEIIVVDDGSTDATGAEATAAGAKVIRHPISRGNGAAVKTAARHATRPLLLLMDADGQHAPADIPKLIAVLDNGYDMVIGTRSRSMHAGLLRWLANTIYNTLASWISGVTIRDLTSGFRLARAELFRQFLPLLPNGFSYPTTITMAFLRAGYGVAFEPVQVRKRRGNAESHIRPLRDGGRFFLIIFRVGTLYSPLKIFLPISVLLFLSGLVYYSYTFITAGRFTNLGVLFFSSAIIVFLIGLISEQITTLLYLERSGRTERTNRTPDP